MSKALALPDILAPLTRGQKEYLLYRMAGCGVVEAEKKTRLKDMTLEVWDRTEEFKSIEKHVLENRSLYRKELISSIVNVLSLKSLVISMELIDLAGKGIENVPKHLVPHLMTEVRALRNLSLTAEGIESQSYDEVILKRRRAIGNV